MSDRLEKSSPREFQPGREATNLRKQAEGMRPGICRDDLLRKANQMDAAARANG
jgi:hypothetical protein